jgi:hypothetical protein
LAKAALNRQSIQYERRAILLQVCGRPWSVMDDGCSWCGAPLASTYVLRRKKITLWKQGVLTYTYSSTSTIRGTINSTFPC